ncbi:MAG: Mth938-like domain-containing protein [Paracoccaceae bacterium]
MRLNEVTFNDAVPIDGYGSGYFRIGGEAHTAPLAMTPKGISEWAGLEDSAGLLAACDGVDVILIGTGAQIAHIPDALRDALEGAGFGVEIMASAQACRTYNVLLGEGRRIALALMPL